MDIDACGSRYFLVVESTLVCTTAQQLCCTQARVLRVYTNTYRLYLSYRAENLRVLEQT
jgi:hypothetical protein